MSKKNKPAPDIPDGRQSSDIPKISPTDIIDVNQSADPVDLPTTAEDTGATGDTGTSSKTPSDD